VDKVTKAFRVYYSAGPSSSPKEDDYIVDHTVIVYLVAPDGKFYDYYGQNRSASEIAQAIQFKSLKKEMEEKKGKGWFSKG